MKFLNSNNGLKKFTFLIIESYYRTLITPYGLFTGLLTYVTVIYSLFTYINLKQLSILTFLIFIVGPILHFLIYVYIVFKVKDAYVAENKLRILLDKLYTEENDNFKIIKNDPKLSKVNPNQFPTLNLKSLTRVNFDTASIFAKRGVLEVAYELLFEQSFIFNTSHIKSSFESLYQDISYNIAVQYAEQKELRKAYEIVTSSMRTLDEQPDLLTLKGDLEISMNEIKKGQKTLHRAKKLQIRQKKMLKGSQKRKSAPNIYPFRWQ